MTIVVVEMAAAANDAFAKDEEVDDEAGKSIRISAGVSFRSQLSRNGSFFISAGSVTENDDHEDNKNFYCLIYVQILPDFISSQFFDARCNNPFFILLFSFNWHSNAKSYGQYNSFKFLFEFNFAT